MEILTATIEQMAFLFCLIALGVILAKVKAIPEGTAAVLGKLENNLLIPALVLYTFATNFTTEKLASAGKLFLLGLGISMVMCVVAMPLGLNAVVVPAAYGKDTSVAAGISIISHVISCATIPLIFYLMMNWVL